MKNKGFTLMELLAVIIILGVLIGLGISAYTKYFVKSKSTIFEISEESFRTAAMDAMADCLTGEGAKRQSCKNLIDNHAVSLENLIQDAYIDPIRDPSNKDQLCDLENSKISVSQGESADRNNIDFTYEVCLICGKYRSKACPK
ncbi:MAG: prepilin-type N-terminal cleavage/methylation domain-containing protein [bacterium]|nr:prepilin-type N-terminal cleavage/methylation domain-containing protein [bacterium]